MSTQLACNTLDWLDLNWSEWQPLDPATGALSTLSTDPGLYRVRHPAYDGLVYVGESGRSIRGRVQALARGAYATQMPFRDPHTAAPTLWAIHQEHSPALEVSWVAPPNASDSQIRKSIEAALIATHRRDIGHSPTANFGRMISGYKQSSYRRDGEVGGPLPEDKKEPNATPGTGPLPWTDAQTLLSPTWMGLDWSSPTPLSDVSSNIPTTDGLYRIWQPDTAPPLEYLGQSANLLSRLRTHRRNRSSDLRYGYVVLTDHDARHKREEIEMELIGAHWLACNASPHDQF